MHISTVQIDKLVQILIFLYMLLLNYFNEIVRLQSIGNSYFEFNVSSSFLFTAKVFLFLYFSITDILIRYAYYEEAERRSI